MSDADATAFADGYTLSASNSGFEKFESMTAARAVHLLALNGDRRGFGLIGESATATSTIGGTIRQELAGEIECYGPFVSGIGRDALRRALLAAFGEQCKAMGLVPALWLSERDTERRRLVEDLGWRPTSSLQWLRHATPIRSPGLCRFASDIRLGDARHDLDTYLAIYNEGFSTHVGDCEATMDDVEFKLTDPFHLRSEFTIAYLSEKPAGTIEYWQDKRADGTHIGWITNIIVRREFRGNVEVLLALGSRSARAMSQADAVSGKGLLDPTRSTLSRLYLMLGCTIHEQYVAFSP